MQPQSQRTDADDLRVIPEQADELRGKDEPAHGKAEQHPGGDLRAEPEGVQHTAVLFGAVVEPAHRLEPLPEPDESGAGELGDAAHHGHSRDGGVPIGVSDNVQSHAGHASQPLAEQGRQAAPGDLLETLGRKGHAAQADGNAPGDPGPHKQQDEADELADDGGQRRAGNAQIQDENEQRIQGNIDEAASGDADHGKESVALEADLVIQHQLGCHVGGPQQNDTQVILGERKDRLGGTQQAGEGIQEKEPEDRDQKPQAQGHKEAGGGQLFRRLGIFGAQLAGDGVARAVAAEKAQSLNDGHHRENDPYGGGGAGTQLPHKEGICHIVEGCNEHTDDGGHGQPPHQPRDGVFRHHAEFFFLRHFFRHKIVSFKRLFFVLPHDYSVNTFFFQPISFKNSGALRCW